MNTPPGHARRGLPFSGLTGHRHAAKLATPLPIQSANVFFRPILATLIAAALLAAPAPEARSAEQDAAAPQLLPVQQLDFARILTDIQRIRNDGTRLYMAIWAVPSFWSKAINMSGGDPDSADFRKFMQLSKDYHVLLVARIPLDDSTGARPASEQELREGLRVLDDQGNSLSALPDKQINRDMRAMMAMLREYIRETNDGAAQEMHILVFPAKNRSGKHFGDATRPGTFIATIDDQRFDYRLPLGSLLVPKRDPATGESFPGNYDYNPFTGARLETAPATK